MIRPLVKSDIPAAIELGASSGWNQIGRDWLRLISHDPNGCFAAMVDDRLVATVTSTAYGKRLAWIGMMLVHPDYRGRGIAKQLMIHCLDHLRNQSIDCIKLDATPVGLPVYQSIGFQIESEFNRWQLDPHSRKNRTTTTSNTTDTIDEQLDLKAFGANRLRFLDFLQRDSVIVSESGNYAMLRAGRRCDYLGPVVANDPRRAEKLIQSALQFSTRSVFWDVPPLNRHAKQLAIKFGFEPIRDLSRMRLGRSIELDMSLQYAMSDPGTG